MLCSCDHEERDHGVGAGDTESVGQKDVSVVKKNHECVCMR
jgi:hypothetical protein